LIGIQRHKQAPELLQALLRRGDAVRVRQLPEHSSWSAAELRAALEAAPGLNSGAISLSDASGEPEADLGWLVASAGLPVACGSLYLVANLLPHLDPAPTAPADPTATD
jgi:dihydrofolate synthase / folylpolyglutamate synthase